MCGAAEGFGILKEMWDKIEENTINKKKQKNKMPKCTNRTGKDRQISSFS